MPKLKSNRSAKKRFRLTANKKVKRTRANKSHLMVSFSSKRVRRLRRSAYVASTEEKTVRRMLLG